MDEREGNYWEGVQGDDLSIPFQLCDENGVGVDISEGGGTTDIVGEFTNGNGYGVQVKLSLEQVTLVDAGAGRGILIVSAATSATLVADKNRRQTFDIYIIKNSTQQTWIFQQGLLLKPRPVPAPAP